MQNKDGDLGKDVFKVVLAFVLLSALALLACLCGIR